MHIDINTYIYMYFYMICFIVLQGRKRNSVALLAWVFFAGALQTISSSLLPGHHRMAFRMKKLWQELPEDLQGATDARQQPSASKMLAALEPHGALVKGELPVSGVVANLVAFMQGTQ